MGKHQPGSSWSRDAEDVATQLTKSYSEDFLDGLLQVCGDLASFYLISADLLASIFQANGRRRGFEDPDKNR